MVKDLREWIALLEREEELVRVSAEVDPRLEVTEIVDRTVRAGGPALLFEQPKGSSIPLLINQFGTERRMCLAFGVDSLDDIAAKLAEILELQPPEGLAAKVRGLRTLKSIADSRPRVVKRGASQEVVLQGDEVDLGRLPVQTCWPGDAGPFITLPGRDHARSAHRPAQCRDVSHAGPRPAVDRDALADPQGRPGGLPLHRRPHGGRGRARARSDHRLLGERAASEAHRRADGRGLPPR